jgi:hypothetical protein
MRAFLPLLFGQNPTPDNHAKLHFTIGISSGSFFMWNQISACFNFTGPEKMHPFLSAIYLDIESYPMEPTGTGQVNAVLPVQSVPP